MNKLALLTTIISFLYFGYMKYFTTHPADVADFVIMVFFTMIFGAWMIAALVIALGSSKEEDVKH
jgi:hypothetical protein